MANNWFALDDGGSNAWAPLEGTEATEAVLRIVGQTPSVSSATGAGEIDGGGEIGYTVEQDFTAFYGVLGYVERDFVAQYQMTWPTVTVVGTLRITGHTPTVAVSDVSWTVQAVVGTLRITGLTPTVTNSGNVWAYPSVGTLRITGLQPQTSPVSLTTAFGRLQIRGERPTVISPFEVYPSSATLRIIARGWVSTDFVSTYQLLSVLAYQDFTATYVINGTVVAAFSSTWNIEGPIGRITASGTQGDVSGSSQTSAINLDARQHDITLMAA